MTYQIPVFANGARGSAAFFFVIFNPIKLTDPDGRNDEYYDYDGKHLKTVESKTNNIYMADHTGENFSMGITVQATAKEKSYQSGIATGFTFDTTKLESAISTAGTISSIPPNTAKMAGITLGTGLKILDGMSSGLSFISFGIDGFQVFKTPTLSNGIDLAISTVGLFGLAGTGVSLMMQGVVAIAPYVAQESYNMQNMMMDYSFEAITGIPNFSSMVRR